MLAPDERVVVHPRGCTYYFCKSSMTFTVSATGLSMKRNNVTFCLTYNKNCVWYAGDDGSVIRTVSNAHAMGPNFGLMALITRADSAAPGTPGYLWYLRLRARSGSTLFDAHKLTVGDVCTRATSTSVSRKPEGKPITRE